MAGAAPKDLGALREVPFGDKADLVLEIGEEGAMALRRLDERVGALKNATPKLSLDEVKAADFPYILNAIARFNRFLATCSSNSSTAARPTVVMNCARPTYLQADHSIRILNLPLLYRIHLLVVVLRVAVSLQH